MRQFTETLRLETKGTGVRVHGLNPGLVETELLGRVSAQAGYGQRLGALQVVVGLWGQDAREAARPIVGLVTSDAAEYRFLTRRRLVTHGLHNVLRGRLRRSSRMPLDVTVVDGHPGD